MDVRESLNGLEKTVDRHIKIEGYSGEGSKRKQESCKESVYHYRECTHCRGQNIGRDMNVKCSFW